MQRTLAKLFVAYVPSGASTAVNGKVSNPHHVTASFRRLEQETARADADRENRQFFYLPRLDYDTASGIAPLMSKRQFDIQYELFHRDAVDRLNAHTLGSELEGHNLDVVIRKTSFDATQAVIHAAASEHFNYCFWYKTLRPWGTSVPPRLREALQLQYGENGARDAVDEVSRLFRITAQSQLTLSGWVYLVWTGKVFDIVSFQQGTCPIGSDLTPLLALNLHASALYFDYTQEDPLDALEQYVTNFFKTCNWTLAEHYFVQATQKQR